MKCMIKRSKHQRLVITEYHHVQCILKKPSALNSAIRSLCCSLFLNMYFIIFFYFWLIDMLDLIKLIYLTLIKLIFNYRSNKITSFPDNRHLLLSTCYFAIFCLLICVSFFLFSTCYLLVTLFLSFSPTVLDSPLHFGAPQNWPTRLQAWQVSFLGVQPCPYPCWPPVQFLHFGLGSLNDSVWSLLSCFSNLCFLFSTSPATTVNSFDSLLDYWMAMPHVTVSSYKRSFTWIFFLCLE